MCFYGGEYFEQDREGVGPLRGRQAQSVDRLGYVEPSISGARPGARVGYVGSATWVGYVGLAAWGWLRGALGSAGVTQVGVEDGKNVLVAGVLLREDEIRVALDEQAKVRGGRLGRGGHGQPGTGRRGATGRCRGWAPATGGRDHAGGKGCDDNSLSAHGSPTVAPDRSDPVSAAATMG